MAGELVKAKPQAALSEHVPASKDRDGQEDGPDLLQRYSDLPIVAKLCVQSGIAQVALCIVTLLAFGLGPSTQMTREMSWHFMNARNMLLPAYVMEACTLLSSSAGSTVRLTGYNMSRMVMIEFTVKLTTYSLMAASSGLAVHMNLRSFGEPRPVGSLRFLEWLITVPVFLTMNNYPFIGNTSPNEFFFRIMPGLMCTFGYILVSWVALVTPNAVMGWFLLILTNVTFGISVLDQLAMVKGMRDTTTNYNFKLGVVVSKDLIFFAYGAVYLLSVFNLMSPTQEQIFYTYGDVILKVWQASCLVVLRNWQDLVTVKRTFECQLSRSKEDTARLIRKANALMLVMDIHGVITGWNEYLADTTGITEKSAVGKKFQDVVRPDSRTSVDHALLQCRQGLSCGGVELELFVADGSGDSSSSFVTIYVSFIMQLGSDTSSIIVVGQDLTELVARRALEERQARFESIVSHELRSPLHGIIGLSSVMAEASSDRMQKKQLGMIQGCADRLLDLVNNIMESHQQWTAGEKNDEDVFLARDPVNIMEVIREVCEMTRASVDKAGKPLLKPGVKLVTKLDCKRFPVVQGDQQKLTQMLYNITTNACNFTTKGSISVAVRSDDDVGEGFMELEITDTGPGIGPSALRRIFEPFEQEDSKDTRKFQGVGLGLSVAQNIAKAHGGGITVNANAGKGSTFVVRLPCESDMSALYARSTTEDSMQTLSAPKTEDDLGMHDAPEPIDACAMHEKAEQVKVRLSELRAKQERSMSEHKNQKPFVLIVDNDQVSQQILSQNLQSMARSQQCFTAAQAIKFLQKPSERPRLVIVDLLLPGLGGLEVCMEIRHRMKLSHLELPIIVLCTRTAREELATQAFWAGATDLVQMPATGAFLRMRVKVGLDMQEIGVAPSTVASLPTIAASPPSTPRGGAGAMPAPASMASGGMDGGALASAAVAAPKLHAQESSHDAKALSESLEQFRKKLEQASVLQAAEASRRGEAEKRLAEELRAYQALGSREKEASSAKQQAEASLSDREAQIRTLRTELEDAINKANLAAKEAASARAAAAGARAAGVNGGGSSSDAGAVLRGVPSEARHIPGDSSEVSAPPSVARSRAGTGTDSLSFWRAELDQCRSEVQHLRKALCKEETTAYVQRTRADARERELAHMRGQFRRARSQLGSTATSVAAASDLEERLVGS